jgi:hypothetical protein
MKQAPALPLLTGDWLKLPEIRRCTPGERGHLIDLYCFLHNSHEYGVLRGPLVDIVRMTGVPGPKVLVLIQKGALQGGEPCPDFIHRPYHAGVFGAPITLVKGGEKFAIFCEKLVVTHWRNSVRGKATRFTPQQVDLPGFGLPPTRRLGEGVDESPCQRQGDGLSFAVAFKSSKSKSEKHARGKDFPQPEPAITDAVARLKGLGVAGLAPDDPHVRAALAEGITLGELEAVAAGKTGQGKPVAYLVAAARGRRRDAQAAAETPVIPLTRTAPAPLPTRIQLSPAQKRDEALQAAWGFYERGAYTPEQLKAEQDRIRAVYAAASPPPALPLSDETTPATLSVAQEL